jgi:hypothetical protein
MFTARYGLMAYIKQITFRLLKVNVLVFVDVVGLNSDDNFRLDIPLLMVYTY